MAEADLGRVDERAAEYNQKKIPERRRSILLTDRRHEATQGIEGEIVPPFLDLMKRRHPRSLRGHVDHSRRDGLAHTAAEGEFFSGVISRLRTRKPDEERIDVRRVARYPEFAASQRGCPRAAERVEDPLLPTGVVLQDVLDEMKRVGGRQAEPAIAGVLQVPAVRQVVAQTERFLG
jgi:hypothetical protein